MLTQRGLILGYAALSRKQIEQGIARLSDAIDDAIDDPSANVSKLLVRAAVPVSVIQKSAGKGRLVDPHFLRRPALAARRRAAGNLASRRGTRNGQADDRGEQDLSVPD